MATPDDDTHLARIAIHPSADNVLLDDEDLACLGSLVAAITQGQAHMALGATHPALLQHHSQALTQVLRRQDQVMLSVQPFSDIDGLLQQFNLLLEQVSVRDARRAPLKTAPTHIWLLPAAQAYTSDTLQTLQRVLRDFPGLKLRLAFFLEGELGDSALAQWPNLWCWQVAGLDAPRVQALRERAARLGLDAAAETWLTRCGEAPQHTPPPPAPAPVRRRPPWRAIARGSLALLSLTGLAAAGWWALQHPADAQAAWARAQSDVLTPAQAWVKRQIAGLKSPMQAWNPPPLNPETPKPSAEGLALENTPANTPANAAPTGASDGTPGPATTEAKVAASATVTGELGPANTPQDHTPGLPTRGETDTPQTAPLAASAPAAPSMASAAAQTVAPELATQVPTATAPTATAPATSSGSDAPETTATASLPASPTAPPSAGARAPEAPVPPAALPLPVAVRATPDAPRSPTAPAPAPSPAPQATAAPQTQASRSTETAPSGAAPTKRNTTSAGAAVPAPTPTAPNPSPASAKATAKAVPNERPSPQTLATAAASTKASSPVAAPSPQPRPERQTNTTTKTAPAPKPADTTAKRAAPVVRNTDALSPADARASTLADINSRSSASTNAVKGILTQEQDLAPFEVSSRVFNALRDRAILTVATPGAEPKASEAQQKAWVRALPDDKWLLEHGRFESPEAAALWAGSHPGLQHAHMTPLRGTDGKPIYALVTGPFTDQAAAQDYASALAGDAAAPPMRLGAELKQQLAP